MNKDTQETKWSYQVIQDILAEPDVIAIKWSARLDRAYRIFFRINSPPSLHGAGIDRIIDTLAEPYTTEDIIYIIKSNGSEQLFRKIRWVN